MPRLISRTKFPPNEFCVLHPETGQREPFHGSFSEACDFEMAFRVANPGICQVNGWTTNMVDVENYVDEYNALRCLAHGWNNFVEDGAAFPDLGVTLVAEKKSLLGAVVDKARAVRSGAATYIHSFFGHGGMASQVEADARALVCVSCPLNDTKSSLWSLFVTSAATEIMHIFEHLHGLKMTTEKDAELGVCAACLCPMKAKIWVNLEHIIKNMPADVVSKLHKDKPRCWIL